jgi:hypothetical protein
MTPISTPNQIGDNSGTNAAIPPSGSHSAGNGERQKWGSRSLPPSGRSQRPSIRLVAPRYGTHLDENSHYQEAIASRLHPLGAATTFTATADPNDWGRPQVLAGWLWQEFIEVASTRWLFSWDFPTVTAALDYFLAVSPGHSATPVNGRPDISSRPG